MSTWNDGEWGNRISLGSTHLRSNDGGQVGFSGIELACDKDDLGFTFENGVDKLIAVSGDGDDDHFSGDWGEENIPSTNLDDITTSTVIPEFSTLLMPIASVMLIVGNRIKNKKVNQH